MKTRTRFKANHIFSSIETIKLNGFEGFVTWKHLRKHGYRVIPSVPGVYLVLNPKNHKVRFLEKSVGGFFEERDPTAPTEMLKENWIEDATVIYIGKATNLRNRISIYSRFGQGKPAPHSGGKYIWQLKNSEELLVCWKHSRSTEDPLMVEHDLILEFKKQYGGKRPFANLRD